MSEKSYNLAEVSEILHISPDTIYKWESHMPQIKPERSEGGRRYNVWELELLKHTKRFFFTYNQEIPMTLIAVERWVRKNPRPSSTSSSTSEELPKLLKTPQKVRTERHSGEHLSTGVPNPPMGRQRMVAHSNEDLLFSDETSTKDTFTPKEVMMSEQSPRFSEEIYHDSSEMLGKRSTGFEETHLNQTAGTGYSSVTGISSGLNSSPMNTTNTYSSYGATYHPTQITSSPLNMSPTSISRSLTVDSHSMNELSDDHSEIQTWKRAFNQTQAELAQTKGELTRAKENLQQQHAAIKQIQADFNALKELIRKEIYDLRDLVIDK